MSEKHWDTDKPETPEQALELLRFGVISPLDRNEQYKANARTERRMLAAADVLEQRIRELETLLEMERSAS